MTGGEALNLSIVLARLGWQVRLNGNSLGDSPEYRRLTEFIRNCGIDDRNLTVKSGFSGVHEIVFSDRETRTIFGNYEHLLSGEQTWNTPQKSDIADARIVCVDPPFGEESALVATLAEDLGVPFVSVDCPYDDRLSTLAAAVIVSGEFRDRAYPQAALPALTAEYQARSRGLVILTHGERDLLYGRFGETARTMRPPPVTAVDTAGAGDSFRAGVIYGFLRGWNDTRTVELTSWLAAMVCERFPGVLESPSEDDVGSFMEQRRTSE